ncbi:MAG TPA: lamin tail domain-containing protein [Saprospiraceae bacterium]|nr:lamin tail domain-containing protein [Saprospiraceae bacterium]
MKYFLLFISLLSLQMAFAQCNELFISEYVEGSGNNRALEIYNPTDRIVDLSEYSVGRFRNGSTTFTAGPIPEGNSIGPDETFVIVIDKRDSLGSGFDQAVWNGYILMEPSIDSLTGEVRVDNSGDTILFPVFDENLDRFLYGDYYRERFDLQGKANIFVNPFYEQATSFFYFNGNDAVALIKGEEVLPDGSNIIDVIGVIGEDPEVIYGDPYWSDNLGRRVTANSTLVKNERIEEGTGVVLTGRDTFPYGQWNWNFNNTFTFLGDHTCSCHDAVDVEEQLLTDIGLEIFPNPWNNGSLQIQVNAKMKAVSVYNSLGLPVTSEQGLSVYSYTIKNSNWPSGTYFLMVELENGERAAKKLMIP